MTVHLYDPATSTHYDNGGEIAIDSEVPAPGFVWLEGKAPDGSGNYNPLTREQALATELFLAAASTLPPLVHSTLLPVRGGIQLEIESPLETNWSVKIDRILGAISNVVLDSDEYSEEVQAGWRAGLAAIVEKYRNAP